MNIHVRLVTPKDLRDYFQQEREKSYKDIEDLLTEARVRISGHTFYGAFDGETMVGFISVLNGSHYTDALHVAQSHRRQGIASSMVKALKILSTIVSKRNDAGVALFEKLGFSVHQTLPFAHMMSRLS